MAHKSVLFWVASLLLMLASLPLLAGGEGERGSIRIEGRVVFEDGEPFSGAIVTVTELRGRLFMMPAVKQQVSVVADHNGRFAINLIRVESVLDVSAKSDSCVWAQSSVIQLYPGDWRGKDDVRVDLKATRGDCPELTRKSGGE
ncbi:MAG: hypothetical protein CVV12_13695 [Gammaproteobacteria bacterium HGW-Gammaproteobacteria-2]|jgi:hypothetical protein|nr:MAG: hypothetical protein CVV12_13695 [Gammaproteobacteria bacterium HGW-Gammaproteobacteria-2]